MLRPSLPYPLVPFVLLSILFFFSFGLFLFFVCFCSFSSLLVCSRFNMILLSFLSSILPRPLLQLFSFFLNFLFLLFFSYHDVFDVVSFPCGPSVYDCIPSSISSLSLSFKCLSIFLHFPFSFPCIFFFICIYLVISCFHFSFTCTCTV